MRSPFIRLALFITIANSMFAAAPTPVSVSPSSGSGPAQTFTFTFSDPVAATNIVWTQIDFGATLSTTSSCFFYYDRASNSLYLEDDAGVSHAPVIPGSPGTAENSQCKVDSGTSSVSAAGTILTMRLALTFKPAYAGTKNIYAEASNGTVSGWVTLGTWTPTVSGPPSAVSVSPNAGSGAGQTFTFTFSDPVSAGNIIWTQIDVGATLSTTASCFFYYDAVGNGLYLEDDAGVSHAPLTPGVAGTAQNSQCTVDSGASSVSEVGTILTLRLALTFKPAYAGAKNIYAEVSNGQVSGWATLGSWTVPSAGADYTITVTPTSQTVVAGGGTSYGITLTSVNGFSGQVSLTASGFPTGASGSFNPTPVTLTANSQASSTLNVTTASNTPAGTYGINIQASGSINHNTSVSLTVSAPATNFTIAVTPGQTMAPGDTTSYAVTVTSVSGFSGNVTLGASGLGSGATATFTPSVVSVSSNGPVSSVLMIGTSASAQTGTFTVSVQGTGGSSTPATTSLTLSTSSTPAQQLTTFINCAASTSSTYCVLPTLPAGNHYTLMQAQTIAVNHQHVTISGGSSTRSQTLLVRDMSNTSPMMTVNAPVCVDAQHHPENCGITIQYLTFCGNGNAPNQAVTTGSACPPLPVPPNKPTCAGQACRDLEIDNVDTGTNPQTPFDPRYPDTSVYTGPFSLIISNCDFEDATGDAIWMFDLAPSKINDVWIHDTAVNYSAVTGIRIDANLENDRKVCDNDPNWANNTSIFLPRNILIGDRNTFNGNLQGSIAESGRWIAVRNSTFTDNYITTDPNSGGGTMTFNTCADTIQIYTNTLDMNGASPPSNSLDGGLELYGRNIYVQGNTIKNYPWAGVSAASTYNLHIENNTQITNNSTKNTTGGVLIEDLNTLPCDQLPRDTQGLTISGNTNISGQPNGIKFGDRARNTIEGVSISGNTITSSQYPIYINDPIVVVSGTINGYPCPGANCATTGPTPGNDPPRALTPDAVGSAAPPIVTARCPAAGQGNAHETFGFSASDVKGPGHLTNLEVMFSIGGADKTGLGGPDSGAQGCHLLYITSPTNMLYLDGPNGGYHWDQGGNSVVGSNGKDITNTYCTVHAGSSVSKVWTEPYILDLQLDIEFLNSQSVSMNKHIYIVTVNQNAPPSNVSNAGAWTYYGWWSTP